MTRRVPLAMRLGALVAALLLPAVAPLLPSVVPRWPAAPFGVAAAQASEEPAPLYLSQALADAQRCGPGFASARMDGEALRLEQLARAAELAPRLRIGAATDLRPGVQTRPVLQLEWDLFEYLSVAANLPNTVTVDYTRPLWPPDEAALRRAVDELDLAVRTLEHEQSLVNARRAVVEAFHAVSVARAEAELAKEALALAQKRAGAAGDRYASGQIGVREWQEAQQAQRQAEVGWQRAQTRVREAETHLVRLLWGACNPELDGQVLAGRQLIDDWPWDAFIAQVQGVLAQPEAAWQQRVLELSIPYQRAILAQRRQELALAEARRNRGFNVSAGASITVPASGSGAGQADFRAQITASLDLSRSARIREEQASLSLVSAKARVEQARLEALDALASARFAIQDAQFARDVAERGVRQAADDLAFVQRRWEAGFAGPLELAQVELSVAEAALELAKSDANLRQAWLALGVLLGVELPE
ncbi:MAG TPA: TolC family protein [Limnochordales bacterium]